MTRRVGRPELVHSEGDSGSAKVRAGKRLTIAPTTLNGSVHPGRAASIFSKLRSKS